MVKNFNSKVIIILLFSTLGLVGDCYPNFHKNFTDKSIENSNNKCIYLAYNINRPAMNISKEKSHTYSMKISNNDPKYINTVNEMKVVFQNKFNIENKDVNALWDNSSIYKVSNINNSTVNNEFIVVFNPKNNEKAIKCSICLFETNELLKDIKLLDYDKKSIILNMV